MRFECPCNFETFGLTVSEIMAVKVVKNELKKHEIAILEQKYQFYLRHCKSKVVRYENTSLSILGSSLYDDFPERYGYLMLKNELKKHEIAILEQKYQFYLRHCKSKVVRYENTSLSILRSSLYDNFPERYGYLMLKNELKKHEIAILEQKYQFYLRHCKAKLFVMKERVCGYLDHYCTTIFQRDMAI